MNIAFERKLFLDYMWKTLKDKLPPTDEINKKNYKSMTSYWKSLGFMNNFQRMGKIKRLKKIFYEHIKSFGNYLKNDKSVEKILIFKIVNRDKVKKTGNYDDFRNNHLWSMEVNKIIKNALDNVFIGAETIIQLEFKNAGLRDEYLDKNSFNFHRLK